MTESYVYAWGRGDLGQLGTGGEGSTSSPQRVQVLDRKVILHAAANLFNSAFVTGQLSLSGQGPPRLVTLSSSTQLNRLWLTSSVVDPSRWHALRSTELLVRSNM